MNTVDIYSRLIALDEEFALIPDDLRNHAELLAEDEKNEEEDQE